MTWNQNDLWRERYRALFDGNVAGIILTNIDGHIVDCNESFARIFGFESQDEVLRLSAWDFYYDRVDRAVLLDRLRTQRTCPAEEVCLRGRNGAPVWVLATRCVASFEDSQPDLLQGTVIDISVQRQAQAKLQEIKDSESRARMPDGKDEQISDLSQRLATLLQRASNILQPNNLSRIGKPEIQGFLFVLEQMKMLMAELEVRRWLGE